jgi:hypothetical protein
MAYFRPDARLRFARPAELGPIDRRHGGIIRAVVRLGEPIELLRRLGELSFTAE